MKDTVKKWLGFAIGCLVCVMGLITLINSISAIDSISTAFKVDNKLGVYLTTSVIVEIACGALMIALGVLDMLLLANINKLKNLKVYELEIIPLFNIITCILAIIFAKANTTIVIAFILSIAAFVTGLVAEFNKNNKGVLFIVSASISALIALISLANSAQNIVDFLYFGTFIAYFIFTYFIKDKTENAIEE